MYKIGEAKLITGDNVAVLKTMPDNYVDLTVTSPPYDNLRTYNGFTWDFEVLAKELYRVTKPGGVVVWVVGDATVKGSETGTSFKQALFFKEVCGFNLHDTMIYQKDNPPPVGGSMRYYQSFEYCFVLTKGSIATFNPIVEPRRNKWNDKRTQRTRGVTRNKEGIFTEKTVPTNENVRLQNVWNYTVSGGSVSEEMYAHKHPAIFPESLARDHIVSWSNEGDVVLDPFMGSGTTGKMALLNNRKFVGIELSQEYVEIAKQRMKPLDKPKIILDNTKS